MRVDGPTLHIIILILKTIGQQHTWADVHKQLLDLKNLIVEREESFFGYISMIVEMLLFVCEHSYHMFYLLLCNKVQLELLEEEVRDQAVHLDGLGVLGKPLLVVIHQGHQPVPGRPVVTLQ